MGSIGFAAIILTSEIKDSAIVVRLETQSKLENQTKNALVTFRIICGGLFRYGPHSTSEVGGPSNDDILIC